MSGCGRQESAEYHYKRGLDLLATDRYEEAKTELEIVMQKYPSSPLVTAAKQQLTRVNRKLDRIAAEKIVQEKRRQEASIGDYLSIIDNRKHSAEQFLSILNVIQNYYPEYTRLEIGDRIAYAYKEVHEQITDISIYEVAKDIVEMVIAGNTGTLTIKLNEIIATYMILRPREY